MPWPRQLTPLLRLVCPQVFLPSPMSLVMHRQLLLPQVRFVEDHSLPHRYVPCTAWYGTGMHSMVWYRYAYNIFIDSSNASL